MKGSVGEPLLSTTPSEVQILDDEGVSRITLDELVGRVSRCRFHEARELVL
jgi:hypothetical protein